MRKKLKSRSGETLVESLVALLIIVLSLGILAGAIVSAARVNKKNREVKTDLSVAEAQASAGTVTITHLDSSSDNKNVTIYKTQDDNGYVFYESIDE